MAAKKAKIDKTKETAKPEAAETPKVETAKKKPEAARTFTRSSSPTSGRSCRWGSPRAPAPKCEKNHAFAALEW
jgi:hypothetical protein